MREKLGGWKKRACETQIEREKGRKKKIKEKRKRSKSSRNKIDSVISLYPLP